MMLAIVPNENLTTPKIRRRINKQPDSFMGHGFFKVQANDLIYRMNQQFTYVIQQLSYDNWRVFIFKHDFLVHTSRYVTVQLANQKADNYIWSAR